MSQAIGYANQNAPERTGSGAHAIDLRGAFERMKATTRERPASTYEERMAGLERLAGAIRRRQDEMAEAVRADFGNRSVFETKLAEVLPLLDGIKYVKKNLRAWMRPESRHVAMTYKPARAKVHFQPLGVIGVISPWNYPFQLGLAPITAAIAAGNRIMLKPSEYSPASSETLRRILEDAFDTDTVRVVLGGPDVGEAFSRLPFDHLLYTGSTHVGRLVMRAAAENLVPVTLELGGKSPAIVHPEFGVEKAAARIAWGKWMNAGQTCIAPDYVLVHESRASELSESLAQAASRYYPTLAANPDYTAVVNARHYERINGLVADAVSKGARKVEVNPASELLSPAARKIAPTLLTGVTDAMVVMQEEIFGPVLPIVTYRSLDEAVAYVNARPRPLALYYFDDDAHRVEDVLARTVSGGAAINETMLHFGIDDMPFGGVGPSGMGSYHGKEGFETFSHKKSVLYQARWNAAALLAPPYGERARKLMEFLLR
ncbi:MAG TPA: coniferyl aldehyde dehydrogenase [Polyangiaceae bacterium]|jgi:coniferyl-aldehyde dehydrogenase|nr:coniferyl aldehyde dehydrogenase [Polyangiaceae bacterium]